MNDFRLAPTPAHVSDAELSGLFRLIDPADSAQARHTDSSTSHVAALSLDGGVAAIEERVLRQLRWCGERGATSHELAELLDLSIVTVSPRLRPLANKGLIVASSERRRTPATRRGSIVWRAQPCTR